MEQNSGTQVGLIELIMLPFKKIYIIQSSILCLQNLLGEGGLLSLNSEIAAGAAKVNELQ